MADGDTTNAGSSCAISNIRKRRGVVRASITRLGNRLKELEEAPNLPNTVDHAQQLTSKLELNSRFGLQSPISGNSSILSQNNHVSCYVSGRVMPLVLPIESSKVFPRPSLLKVVHQILAGTSANGVGNDTDR